MAFFDNIGAAEEIRENVIFSNIDKQENETIINEFFKIFYRKHFNFNSGPHGRGIPDMQIVYTIIENCHSTSLPEATIPAIITIHNVDDLKLREAIKDISFEYIHQYSNKISQKYKDDYLAVKVCFKYRIDYTTTYYTAAVSCLIKSLNGIF